MTTKTGRRESPYTVAQLTEALKKYSPDMRVFVRGYEGGYHDAGDPRPLEVKLNVEDAWYYGPHESCDEDTTPDVKGVVI